MKVFRWIMLVCLVSCIGLGPAHAGLDVSKKKDVRIIKPDTHKYKKALSLQDKRYLGNKKIYEVKPAKKHKIQKASESKEGVALLEPEVKGKTVLEKGKKTKAAADALPAKEYKKGQKQAKKAAVYQPKGTAVVEIKKVSKDDINADAKVRMKGGDGIEAKAAGAE